MHWKEALSPYLSCAHIHQRARWRWLSPNSPGSRNPSKSINSPKVSKARQLCSLHDSWTPKVHRWQEELKSPLTPKLMQNNEDTSSKKTKQKQLLNSATLLPRPFLNWSRQVSPLSSWNFSYFPPTWSALPLPCLQPLGRWNALSLPPTHSTKDPIHSRIMRTLSSHQVQYPPRCLGTCVLQNPADPQDMLIGRKRGKGRGRQGQECPTLFSLSWEGTRLMRKKLDGEKQIWCELICGN